MKKILMIVMAAAAMVACRSEKKAQEGAESTPKVLVLYYSQTGATRAVANEICQQLGADIDSVQAVKPYDGSFEETIARCQEEMSQDVKPELEPTATHIADYDIIFLGYPIWFGTYAPPIATLVAKYKFEGKKIVPFCTFGSGGLESSVKQLKDCLPNAEILEGFGIRNARISKAADEVKRFLIAGGYLEGEISPLPEYSEQQPVSEQEQFIFDQACGDYQFPLGTPISVGSRQGEGSTDYLFTVASKDQKGADVESQIYVTLPNEEGAKAEFTRVVRP